MDTSLTPRVNEWWATLHMHASADALFSLLTQHEVQLSDDLTVWSGAENRVLDSSNI